MAADTALIMEYVGIVRGGLGISQADFAERIGVSPRHYSRLEIGENEINGGDLARVLTELRVPLDHLSKLTDKTATPDIARALAKDLLSDRQRQQRMQGQVEGLTIAMDLLGAARDGRINLDELRAIVLQRIQQSSESSDS